MTKQVNNGNNNTIMFARKRKKVFVVKNVNELK